MAQPQQINISDLDLGSLQQVKIQLEEVFMEIVSPSLIERKLKNAQARFADCAESVDTLKSERAEGKLSNVEKVIVDVGTGYYVEKSTADASKFYRDKVDYVKKNLETLQETVTSKQSSLRAIINVMQEKIQQQQQEQKA
ncbi:subunit of tubulin prefoldin [Apophysomyces ossiformis]|uniref:Subunit of tubulin prefoldin n=1 Tax=Apophysomyces ossiformis TaxID=679940 RepID=A0A8H7BMS8_9FUNG|nr:subunit of tubulin prefoldin [Apophysomyces ossiformis]